MFTYEEGCKQIMVERIPKSDLAVSRTEDRMCKGVVVKVESSMQPPGRSLVQRQGLVVMGDS